MFQEFFKIDAEIAFKNKVDTNLWDTLHIRHQSICILLEDIVSDRLEIIGNKYNTQSFYHLWKEYYLVILDIEEGNQARRLFTSCV